MSRDDGIYVLTTKSRTSGQPEYRVAWSDNIRSLYTNDYWKELPGERIAAGEDRRPEHFNEGYAADVFGASQVFASREEALAAAKQLEREIVELEGPHGGTEDGVVVFNYEEEEFPN